MTTDSTDTPLTTAKRAQLSFNALIEALCNVNQHRFRERCPGCEQCDVLLTRYREAASAYDTAIADFTG